MSKKKQVKKDKQTIVMTIIFILLSILVVGLIIDFIIVKNRVDSEKNININVPVLDNKARAKFSVNISNLKKNEIQNYVFKVKNYQDKINKKEVKYDIIFSTESNVELNLEKNSKKIVIKDNKVENLKLKANKKQDEIFKLKIKAKEDIKKDSKLIITINGK